MTPSSTASPCAGWIEAWTSCDGLLAAAEAATQGAAGPADRLVDEAVHGLVDGGAQPGVADLAANVVDGPGDGVIDGAGHPPGGAAGEVRADGAVDLIQGVGRDARGRGLARGRAANGASPAGPRRGARRRRAATGGGSSAGSGTAADEPAVAAARPA